MSSAKAASARRASGVGRTFNAELRCILLILMPCSRSAPMACAGSSNSIGEMAGVVIDAEMFVQPRVAGMFGAQLLEKTDGFRAGLKPAQRLRFHARDATCAPTGRSMRRCARRSARVVADLLFLLAAS